MALTTMQRAMMKARERKIPILKAEEDRLINAIGKKSNINKSTIRDLLENEDDIEYRRRILSSNKHRFNAEEIIELTLRFL